MTFRQLHSPKATAWFETDTVQLEDDRQTTVPVGDVCRNCGIVCSSWPERTVNEVVEMAKTSKKVKGQVLVAAGILSGTRDKDFNPQIVRQKKTIGMRIETKVALVPFESFISYYKLPPAALKSCPASFQVHSWVSEDGVDEQGVVMSLKNMPKKLDYRVGYIYSTTENEIYEFVLTEDKHVRAGQGDEYWRWSSNFLLEERGPCLKSNGWKKIKTAEDGRGRSSSDREAVCSGDPAPIA